MTHKLRNTARLTCLAMSIALHLTSASPAADKTLPGTQLLTIEQPLDEFMVDGIDRFCLRELAASPARREIMWNRDFSSTEAYEKSIAPNRERFREYIGAVDKRLTELSPGKHGFEMLTSLNRSDVIARSNDITVHRVRWQVLDGVTAEGLLLEPEGVNAAVVAIPDADWTPEAFCGLGENAVPASAQLPWRLANNGCLVVVPMLLGRSSEFSTSEYVACTNQSHREFIYRQAFEMGRHVIGYEVQKTLAAVDLFEQWMKTRDIDVPIGVAGVGEGGLLALYSSALDTRIDATLVSGYFQTREAVWEEPIYRNVWALLSEFGDAEIAGMIAPRQLTIEACKVPESSGPPTVVSGCRGGAAPGRVETATLGTVRSEYDRAVATYDKLQSNAKCLLFASGEGDGNAGAREAVQSFAGALLGQKADLSDAETPLKLEDGVVAALADMSHDRELRQGQELQRHVQNLMRISSKVRDKTWGKGDRSSVEKWEATTASLRDWTYDELIGRLPDMRLPMNAKSRLVLDEPEYVGYEITLDCYRDVVAGGILLLPKDLKPGEKRPVVVCQHGLEGTPMDTITEDRSVRSWNYYKGFAAVLCKRGFITYAPQNPYRGKDRFRTLQRKSNPVKRSLFSYIIPQHQRTLDWLATLPNVDANRIAFYGLSYGGKTAVRVPPMLTKGKDRVGYCLSICSADFNEWVKKNVSNEDRYSYLFTGEYEIFEWNMGHVANYAELSSLMVPRPFMVERGHDDGVAPDEWVAWEFAKVRRHYVKLGIGDRVEIEFFNGPHSINGQGTFQFLHRHLNWPWP